MQYHCKTCVKAYAEANKEIILSRSKVYYEKNKGKVAEYHDIYRKANKEAIANYQKIYQINNREFLAQQQKVYAEANKEIIAEQRKNYYKVNSVTLSNKRKEWYKANKKRVSTWHKAYRKTKIGKAVKANSNHKRRAKEKQGDVITNQLLALRQNTKVCYWCGVSLKKVKVHVDHYEPLSKGGEHTLSNLVVTCQSCNNKKSAKDPLTFANSLGKLL